MDPIANMLTSLLNASRVGKKRVAIPYSQFKSNLLTLLQTKGIVAKVRLQENARPKLLVSLAYAAGQPVLHGVRRVSTPGRRVYVNAGHIPYVYDGAGFAVISTSQGLIDDTQARRQKMGGELICKIW